MSGVTDFFKEAGGLLATIAPTVASAFGGPLAGMATQKLIGALGLAPETTREDLEKAILGATPEQLLEIKKVEQQFIIDMKRLDIDLEKIAAGDRDSARQREIETKDNTPKVLAGLIVGLYIYVQWYLLSSVIDPSMKDFVLRSLGMLDAALGLVLGYYFGSSAGSRSKDETIHYLNGKQ